MESFFSFYLFLLVAVFLYLCFTSRKKHVSSRFMKSYPIVGNLPEFIKNRHQFLDWTTHIIRNTPTNTLTFYRPVKLQGIITANPLNVEHMLKTSFSNYLKGDRFISILEDFLGRGIFNSDGELWKIQRKVASFEFSTRSLRDFVVENVRSELQTRLIPLLSKTSKSGKAIDMQDILERFAFDNICKVVFNEDPACLEGDGTSGSKFMKAFEDATMLSGGRFLYAVPSLWHMKKFFNIGSERRLKEAIKVVHEFADRIIKARMQDTVIRKEADLLSRFFASENNCLQNSPELLGDIVISFVLAGRDTTSSAMTWFFWLLSSRTDVQHRILEELRRIRNDRGKSIGEAFDLDDLREMHYLHSAISESMRLYPPVAIDTKKCQKDDIMPDGTFVGKGWFATYHTYAMGRMENIWGQNCNEYVPERWLDQNGTFRKENPFRYPVFHGGPRLCLGKDMAYIQMKSIAASVLEKFEIDVENKARTPEHVLALTLRMKNGLMVRVKERPGDLIESYV